MLPLSRGSSTAGDTNAARSSWTVVGRRQAPASALPARAGFRASSHSQAVRGLVISFREP